MAAMNSILSNGCQSEWNILSRQFSCQEATVRHIPDIPEWGIVFQEDGAPAHRLRDTVAFLERKVPDFSSPTLWPPNSPDLNPVDYSIWSVLQENVYRSIIANVSELDRRLINERGRFVQSIVDAAIGQWRRRLSACVRGAGHTLSTKHKVSAILSCIYQQLLNWWKYDKVLTQFVHSFSLETVNFFTFVFNK